MYKKIFIIILLSIFISMSANAEQFNRYEVNGSKSFNYSNTGKLTVIELLVDFSSSMGWAVDITKKTLVYILPKLKGPKLGLRLFGGDLGIKTGSGMCEYYVREKVIDDSKNIYCNANPSQARECKKMGIRNNRNNRNNYKYVNRLVKKPCKKYNACTQTKLVTPFELYNQNKIINGFDGGKITGMTPIELGLKEAVKDISKFGGQKKIILITDGYESCGGDPCAYIKGVVAKNKNLIIDVIIIGKNDNLKCLSDATGGKYYRVDDNTIIDALEKSFEVPKGTADKVRKYKFVDVDNLK